MKNKLISVELLTYEWKNVLSILYKEYKNLGWIEYKELLQEIEMIEKQTKLKVKR